MKERLFGGESGFVDFPSIDAHFVTYVHAARERCYVLCPVLWLMLYIHHNLPPLTATYQGRWDSIPSRSLAIDKSHFSFQELIKPL